jgi:nitrite reductase (cytochrome c-552)
MIQRVNDNQDKVFELRRNAERQLAMLHIEAGRRVGGGGHGGGDGAHPPDDPSAQWRWDWIAASHGAGAHAPTESARLLAVSAQMAGEARLAAVSDPEPPRRGAAGAHAGVGEVGAPGVHRAGHGRPAAQKAAFLQDTLPAWYESAAHTQPGPTDYVPRVPEADRRR